jgi:iron(II)-dependent oxidoreductase
VGATIAPLDPAWLAEAVRDGRDRAIDLVADLSYEQLIGPQLPTVNPLLWEVGHLAWFQEKFVLRQAAGAPPLVPYGDSIWDSGAIPHDTRWRLALPSRSQTLEYMREVGERVAECVLRPGATDVVRHFALYTVFHYDWHTEALTYTRQTLGYPAPALPGVGAGSPESRIGSGGESPPGDDVTVAGGRMLLGALRAQPFAYDNEKWAHPVDVAPFAISRRAVTQEQYQAFVDDGGYKRPDLWSTDGWSWRRAAGADQPVYWRPEADGAWVRRLFDTWRPLEPHRPAVHVNWYEADAWCRWAGRRLPTEPEWELAASGVPAPGVPGAPGPPPATWPRPADRRLFPWGDAAPERGRANLDWAAGDTVDVDSYPAGDSAFGCRQMIGNVWEWTASTFLAYPNFERDAYFENSEQFFGSRKVLRGGSWATRSRLVRNTLRNYLTPDRRDVMAGFRTCACDQ